MLVAIVRPIKRRTNSRLALKTYIRQNARDDPSLDQYLAYPEELPLYVFGQSCDLDRSVDFLTSQTRSSTPLSQKHMTRMLWVLGFVWTVPEDQEPGELLEPEEDSEFEGNND